MNSTEKPSTRPSTPVTAAQRAAIVIAMLGETAAKPIMEKLDDAALAKVSAELETIALIPRSQLTEIVVEFLGQLRQTSGDLLGGKIQARDMIYNIFEHRKESVALATASDSNDDSEAGPKAVQAPQKSVWERLAEKPPEQTAEYLNGLNANLASLVLRGLEITDVSEILVYIDEEKLQPIMARLIESDKDDPGIESVIGRMVELEYLNAEQGAEVEDVEHLENIGELLSLIPPSKRDLVVGYLEIEHGGKLASIQKAVFTLESLPDVLPRNAVSVFFREYGTVEIVEFLSTLHGSLAPVSEFLLANISSRLADQIREDLAGFKALSAEDVERVQREFLLSLMTMKRKGTIAFE